MAIAELEVQITANNTEVISKLTDTESKFYQMGTAFSTAGTALSQTLTQPLVAFGQTALTAFQDFDAAMAGLATVTGGVGAQMDILSQKAMQIGMNTKYSATEAANAMYFMGSAGMSTDQILAALDQTTLLATAANMDLASASEVVTTGLSAFGMSAEQTAILTDSLATAAALSNTNIQEMGGAFKYVAPVAGALGYSVTDVSTALGIMANSGIKAEQAGTTLRSALTELISPSTKAQQVMQQLGISMKDSQGNALPLKDVLVQLRSSFSGLSEEQKTQAAATLFGKEAMSGMLSIINTSDEDFNKMTKAMNESEGSTKKMADTMGGNAKNNAQELQAKIQTLAVEIGEKLAPALEGVLSFVSNLLTWFSNLNSGTQTLILTIIGLVAAIAPVASIIGGVATIAGSLSGIFTALSGVVSFLGSVFAFICSPIGLVIAAIGALIAVGVLLWQNWDKISAWAGQLWQGIKTWWDKIVQSTKELYNNIGKIWEDIKKAISDAVQKAIDWIKNVNWLQLGIDMVMGMVNGVISAAKKLVDAVVNAVKSAVDAAKRFLGISSPSKLMMGIGIDTGDGLALGIDKTYDDVMNASLGLSKSVTDGYEKGNYQSVTSNFTVNVRSPSEIYQELDFINRNLAMGL